MRSTFSRLMAHLAQLPPVETHHSSIEKNLKVPMPDGVILPADHSYSRDLGARPTILFRTAYGKDPAGFVCQLLAERGFQALIQNCRGTDQSGGEFDPFHQEQADGLATLAWLILQRDLAVLRDFM